MNKGDILRIVGLGACGYAKVGDLVRVVVAKPNAVTVQDTSGKEAEFCFNCGAARLEATEWTRDFPVEKPNV